MNHYHKILDQITALLKEHPRGLQLKEISEHLKKNRNTTSKYLDVLLAQGSIQMKRYGPSKVFYLTPGVPINSLIHYSSDCIFILDRNLCIINLNESAKNHACIGNNSDNLEGQKFFQVVKIEKITIENSPFPKILNRVIQGESFDFPAVYVGRKLRNSIRHINLRLYPAALKDEGLGIAVVIQDVTSEIANQQRARQAEEKTSRILASIGAPVSMIDREYTITWANKELLKLLNDSLVGEKCYSAFYNRSSPCTPCIMEKVFSEDNIQHIQTAITTPSGEKKSFMGTVGIVETTPEGSPNTIINVLRDIPSHKGT